MSARTRANIRLLAYIKAIHQKSHGNYGAIKPWNALKQQGIACGKHRVARLRRLNDIVAKRRKRFVVTTFSKTTNWIAPNLLNRHFSADTPNSIWVGDVTFISTREGWLYLAVMIDLYSRKVVGWSMSDRNNQTLVLNALHMAIEHRKPKPGLIHHTDRGQLYAAMEYRNTLEQYEMKASMSRKKDCWDNAVAESFFNNLKNELVYYQRYQTRSEARASLFEYIEVFYNKQRLHQTLNYQSPCDYEKINVA